MKIIFAFAVLVLLALSGAADAASGSRPHRWYPWLGTCEQGYRFDSYGRGLRAGFLGEDAKPKYIDDGCYQLGIDKAKQIAAQADDLEACRADFMAAHTHALRGAFPETGTECFLIGFQAGQADLDVGAREGDLTLVSQSCVDAYTQGKVAARANTINEPPTFDEPIHSCYETGYSDGSF